MVFESPPFARRRNKIYNYIGTYMTYNLMNRVIQFLLSRHTESFSKRNSALYTVIHNDQPFFFLLYTFLFYRYPSSLHNAYIIYIIVGTHTILYTSTVIVTRVCHCDIFSSTRIIYVPTYIYILLYTAVITTLRRTS